MKILDCHSFNEAIHAACEYARASQRHGHGVTLSFSRGIVIVRHDNTHARGFRVLTGEVLLSRLAASIEER